MTERKAFPAATARRAVSHLLASFSCPIFETLTCWQGVVLAMFY
jgi:hypothetical protein